MRTDDFDFHLPEEAIALSPAVPRDAARMLCVTPGAPEPFADRGVLDLPAILRPGDCLVVNDTRVIPSALQGTRAPREAALRQNDDASPVAVHVNLHKRIAADSWLAFAKPAKRIKAGDIIAFTAQDGSCSLAMEARVEGKGEGGELTLRFDRAAASLDQAIAELGAMPLPPYIEARRKAGAGDLTDYQTIYAQNDGAVAAPTAGLHFTPALFDALEARGISRHTLTLHVGAGTFLPVKAEYTADHRMHAEWGEISAQTAEALNAARRAGGRIVAVGTTSLRLLESAAREDGTIEPFCGDTAIFITPGYRFRAVDVLMTNFHLPRSTLFMLVSAFSGLGTMQAAYAHAIAKGYRFYSYGDACLLFRA